jgi:fatty acid desaturase
MSVAAEDLDREFSRFSQKLPQSIGRFVDWLRRPQSRYVRIMVAMVFIPGGIVGFFLPLIAFWMTPVGILLIAQDVPFMRAPMARLLAWTNDRWEKRLKTPRGGSQDAVESRVKKPRL